MKKYLFALTLSIAFLGGYSQIEVSGEVSVITGSSTNPAEEMHFGWEVINSSSQAIEMRCKRNPIQEVPLTANQFCWGTLCGPFGQGPGLSTEIVSLEAGAYSNSFYGNYRPYLQAGETILQFCWYDANDAANEFCHTISFVTSATIGVKENTPFAQIQNISPNPIEKNGSIAYSFVSVPQNGHMTIHNLTGGLVKDIPLTAKYGSVIINAIDFESGIYFCSIEDNGHVYQTQRLVISK